MEDTTHIKELRSAIRGYNGDILEMSKDRFTEWAKSLSAKAAQLFLGQHRENREFFKNILTEEYKNKHPNSFRYSDALDKIKKYNRQGKVLSEIIANKSQINVNN